MALVLADRVQETTTSTGTGSVILAGAVNGYQSFSAGVGNGNTCYYTIYDNTSFAWEVGIGTYTSSGNTLARNTILSSSNSGSAINLAGNTAAVWVDYPSEKAIYKDASNLVAIPYNGASSNIGSLNVGGSTGASDTGYIATFVGNSGTYAYTFTQNTNSGNTAYASHTVGNNAYGTTGAYIDMGVNSTTYNATAAGYPINSLSLPNTTFIESTNGDIAIGSWGANAIHFVVNGTTTTVDAMTISSSGVTSLLNPLGLSSGGTNSNLSAVAGAVAYSSGTAIALSAAGTSGQVLVSGGSGSPTWNTTLTSVSLVTPALGTPASGVLTNTTGYPASTLAGTTLASNVTASSLTSVGTLATLAVTAIISGSINGNAANITASSNTSLTSLANVTTLGTITAFTATAANITSLGVGTPSSGTSGEIRATNNVTAYYSSDKKFKENIQPIESALGKVSCIGGKTFDWTQNYINDKGGEDDYFIKKHDFGVIAQDVQEVFPLAVRTRKDGSLAVDYSKLVSLAFQAIVELKAEVDALKGK